MNKELKDKFAKISLLALDFDGVLTDGYVHFDQNGKETVRCSRKDSLGTNMLQKKGIRVIVVSKETNPIVSNRCRKMGIKCWQGVDTGDNKLDVLRRYASEHGLVSEEICFVGDDVNDIPCIKLAGVGVTVADGHEENKNVANYVTSRNGGCHAVREVCDLILFCRKK